MNSVVNFFKYFEEIILLGGSLGALSASIVAIANKKVTRLITVNGFFGDSDLGKKVKKTYFLYRLASLIRSDFRKDYNFFKNNLIPEKINIPVSVIYTKTDDVVKPTQSERFYSKLSLTKNKRLIPLQLKKHNLTGKGDVDKVVSSINI